jgi:hypothetical protein
MEDLAKTKPLDTLYPDIESKETTESLPVESIGKSVAGSNLI